MQPIFGMPFPHFLIHRHGEIAIRATAAMLTRLLDCEKGVFASEGVCVRACTSEGKRWKDPKMAATCMCSSPSSCQGVCVCDAATSKINSCLETFGKCLISTPLSLSLRLFFSRSTRPFVSVSEIHVVSKKAAKKVSVFSFKRNQ